MPAWHEGIIPGDLTYEAEPGKATAFVEHPMIKETPDLPTFLKRVVDTHSEVGRRVPLKTDGKPESIENWKKEHMPKLYDAGILPKPITDASVYNIKKPDDLAKGLTWSEERGKKFGEIGVKYNLPVEAINELRDLHTETIQTTQNALKLSYDEGIAALKSEWGDKFDDAPVDAKRLTKAIFKSDAERAFFDETELGNHPEFLSVIMRLAQHAKTDSSLVEAMSQDSNGAGATAAEDARAALADIMNNPNNPKHKLYWAGDERTNKEIQEMYKKVHGDKQVVLG